MKITSCNCFKKHVEIGWNSESEVLACEIVIVHRNKEMIAPHRVGIPFDRYVELGAPIYCPFCGKKIEVEK